MELFVEERPAIIACHVISHHAVRCRAMSCSAMQERPDLRQSLEEENAYWEDHPHTLLQHSRLSHRSHRSHPSFAAPSPSQLHTHHAHTLNLAPLTPLTPFTSSHHLTPIPSPSPSHSHTLTCSKRGAPQTASIASQTLPPTCAPPPRTCRHHWSPNLMASSALA